MLFASTTLYSNGMHIPDYEEDYVLFQKNYGFFKNLDELEEFLKKESYDGEVARSKLFNYLFIDVNLYNRDSSKDENIYRLVVEYHYLPGTEND